MNSYEEMRAKDYYMQLDGIQGRRCSLRFYYNDLADRRLRLDSLRLYNGQMEGQKYFFQYNETQLPAYHSRETDSYGYYNGRNYASISRPGMTAYRIPDEEKMQAEILTDIVYPTGGSSHFEYEAHRYSKIATQYPFGLHICPTDSLSSGLRIKTMTDYSSTGVIAEKRQFSYLSEGRSSGILSGRVFHYLRGNHTVVLEWGGKVTGKYDGVYELFSETPLRPLSDTDGNHVTYSVVTETFGDGSRRVYRFSNHDTEGCADSGPLLLGENTKEHLLVNPFSSMSLARGNLLVREDMKADGGLVRRVENTYACDTTDFLLSVRRTFFVNDLIRTCSVYKVFTFSPALVASTVITYHDNGSTSNVEVTEYDYDAFRNVRSVRRKVGGTEERETFTYSGDYASSAPYTGMQAGHMSARPVEHLLFRKDTLQTEKLVSGELTTWKQTGDGLFVPAATYRAALGSGATPTAFTPFDGQSMDSRYGDPEQVYESYDSRGNLLLARDRTGQPTTFCWDKRGVNPTFIVKDAMNGEQTRPVAGAVNRTEEDSYTAVLQIVKSFTCAMAGAFSLTFTPDDPVTDVVITLDGDTLAVRELLTLDPEGAVTAYTYWTHGSSQYLPAGEHEVRVTCTPEPIPVPDPGPLPLNAATPQGHILHGLPFSGTLSITYPLQGIVDQTITGSELFFEDFEAEEEGPEGYYSGRGHLGTYAVSMPDLNTYRGYVLDYWRRTGTGPWEYVRTAFTGIATIGGPGITVDQVRVYPEDAEVDSYTWDESGNLLSRTDGRGVTESYRYDGLGRLTGVYDNEGNKVEGYLYNYKNQ